MTFPRSDQQQGEQFRRFPSQPRARPLLISLSRALHTHGVVDAGPLHFSQEGVPY